MAQAGLVACADLATKHWASSKGYLKWVVVSKNSSTMFDMPGPRGFGLVVLSSGFAVGFVGWAYSRYLKRQVGGLPVALLAGGFVGNLSDRFRMGFVRDWLKIGPSVWNLADLAIAVGLVLLMFESFRSSSAREVKK